MKRSKFSLSNYKLGTYKLGTLYPINWFEALPGDTLQISTAMLVRMAPILAPIMHPVKVRIHHWFVPNRLLWENWESFITGGEDGLDSSVVPYYEVPSGTTPGLGSFLDHFGFPAGKATAAAIRISTLPLRAYNLIWNEYYRDQDLQSELTVRTGDGPETWDYSLQQVNWEKDYFTTCRPWEQKGAEVIIPLSGDAPVKGIGKFNQAFPDVGTNVYETGSAAPVNYANAADLNQSGSDRTFYIQGDAATGGDPQIYADLANATGMTINDLRLALAIQRYQEARAQYGSRYVEYLRYLGVRSSDARLQNPEYLGGGKQTIQFSEVVQTAEGTDPVGQLRGHGIAAVRSRRIRRFCEEHGIVLSLMSVVPKAMYPSAIHKKWLRQTKEDYFQKELQFIGDQPVTKAEIYGFDSNPSNVFGYQQRYDEYRFNPSHVSGEFRDTLNYWHYARDFENSPALNSSFISCVPTTRVYADAQADPLYIMCSNNVKARRMMSYNPTPKTF